MKRRIIRTLLWLIFPLSSTRTVEGYNRYKYDTYEQTHEMDLNVCQDSVVAVTYMYMLCDSPYTFYYGNGANRASERCDYGDKASLDVSFQVLDDLQEEDTEIFMTMAAYDDFNNLLTSTYPECVCRDYVGTDCTKAGIYSFQKKLRFGNPADGNRTKFYPVIHMAFSTKADSGYNLGAVNMECQQWNNDEPVLVSWSNESPKTRVEEFAIDYGLLILTCIFIMFVSLFVWIRSRDNPGFDHFPPYVREGSGETSFMDL